MFKNYTYKVKFRLSLIGLILLLIFIYFFNIKKTLSVKKTYNQIKHEYTVYQEVPNTLENLKSRLEELNTVLGSKYECSELPEELVKFSGQYASNKNVTLVELTEIVSEKHESMNFCSLSVILSGSFNNLVRYIYNLETKNKIGRIASVNFRTNAKNKNKKEELFVEIHIQNIEIN